MLFLLSYGDKIFLFTEINLDVVIVARRRVTLTSLIVVVVSVVATIVVVVLLLLLLRADLVEYDVAEKQSCEAVQSASCYTLR